MPDTYQLTESGASVDALLGVIGTDALTTTAQTLTSAVNELDSEVGDNTTDIGDLTSLNTSIKTSLVAAINDMLTDFFKIVSYTASYTVAASSSGSLTADDFSVTTPTGYKPIAITQAGTGNGNVCLRYLNAEATGSSNIIGYRNISSSSISNTASVHILYTRTWGA